MCADSIATSCGFWMQNDGFLRNVFAKIMHLMQNPCMNSLDNTDIRILDALQRSEQLPRKQLAELCHISEATCSRRLASLEKRGFITQHRTVLNAAKLGYGLVVFVLVSMENEHSAQLKKFEARLKKNALVQQLSFISGEYDYLLRLAAKDMAQYHHFT